MGDTRAMDTEIALAVGEELRRAREARRWSQTYLASRLPSGIGARTLLSYEHGARHMTVLRFVEICRVLGMAAPKLLNQALQRARIRLDHVVLRVDVRQLLSARNEKFVPLTAWAHNKLIRNPAGVVDVPPVAVTELADLMGCRPGELSLYLAGFVPEDMKDVEADATTSGSTR